MMNLMEITKMENTVIDFEALSCEEKFDYLNEMLKRIKPECLERVDGKPMKAPKKVRKPLGDFWVNLKDAEEYNWYTYSYEDFVVGLWYCDPNHSHYSDSAHDRGVAFPAIDKDVIPGDASQWTFGERGVKPEWFTDENIQEGNIWVKLLCVHADPEDFEDEEDND